MAEDVIEIESQVTGARVFLQNERNELLQRHKGHEEFSISVLGALCAFVVDSTALINRVLAKPLSCWRVTICLQP